MAQTSVRTPDMLRVAGPGGRGGMRGGPGARVAAEKPKNIGPTLRRLLVYLGRSRGLLLVLVGMMLVITGVDVSGPLLQQKAIDCIQWSGGTVSVDLARMARYLGIMGALFAGSALLTLFQGRIAAKLSQDTVRMLRRDLFGKIARLPIRYLDTHTHGDLMSRMTNDAENISNAIAQSVTTLISALLTLIGALAMMLYYSPLLAAVAVLAVPVTIAVSNLLTKWMRKYYISQQRSLGVLNGQVEEMVTGYRTVVAYGREQEAVSAFAQTSRKLRDYTIRARVWGSIMGPLMNFIGNFQYVLLAGIGGWMMLSGNTRITIGSIQAMLQYSKKFSHPINMIATQFATLLTALAGAERIFAVMDEPCEVDAGAETALTAQNLRGDIAFEHVAFGYEKDEPVLRDLDLRVQSGQKIAIVGATGSGKTTIVNLLTRFYELDGGRITIDGVDITALPKAQLRSAIAIVLQDTVLFSDTIRANIRYGRLAATDAQVKAAADTAMADRFIERLPEGYNTMLAEAGANLSQGQRQLLAIARAVLADPKILILDEATSSVDTRTEMKIQQAMVNLMRGRTSLIIAHRLSTIRDADRIVVVSGGRIAESGSHEELLALGGEYARLYSRQYAGVET
jgi:ATP-binding cassette subfamily B multidrug efflux pump